MAALTAQLEERATEQTAAALAKCEAKWEKETRRMQTEIDSYRNYSSTANYALHSNTKALREAQVCVTAVTPCLPSGGSSPSSKLSECPPSFAFLDG